MCVYVCVCVCTLQNAPERPGCVSRNAAPSAHIVWLCSVWDRRTSEREAIVNDTDEGETGLGEKPVPVSCCPQKPRMPWPTTEIRRPR